MTAENGLDENRCDCGVPASRGGLRVHSPRCAAWDPPLTAWLEDDEIESERVEP